MSPLDEGELNCNAIRNFRPVSVLNTFSKIYEKALKELLISHLDKSRTVSISTYRKTYSTQHVLTDLVEDLRAKLDQDFVMGAIFVDLSNAFDCIPHDLIIAKLHAYGFDENTLVLLNLKRRKQGNQRCYNNSAIVRSYDILE